MRRFLVPFVAAVAMLIVPATANAAFASAISGTTVTVTGAIDAESITVSTNAGLIAHDQTGGGFNSNLDWDTVNAGDQTLPADDTIALVLATGGGDDSVTITTSGFLSTTITGGDGNDVISGSPDVDTIDAGAGDDVVTGTQGADALSGGAGDDLFVWQNGHGSDTIDGGDGEDESRVDGTGAAELYTVTIVENRVRLDRTSPDAFFLSHATTEHVALRTFGGNDTITGAIGLAGATTLTVEAGTGNDSITGGNGDDILFGGPGADAITGGSGSDAIFGGAGDDTITAKDATQDDVWCGLGTDVVSADSNDRLTTCETLTRADHSALVTATTINATKSTSGYVAKVRVSCLSDRACVGNIGLTTRQGIVTSSGVRTVVLFAKVKISIQAGEAEDVSVNLSRYAFRLGTRVSGSTRTTIPVQAAVEIKDSQYVRRTFRNFALVLPT